MRDLHGNIINMVDEANGGYIIRNRQVVNQERWEEILQQERDRQEAAKAIANQVESPNAHLRNQTPQFKDGEAVVSETPKTVEPKIDKVAELEKKVEGMESKLDAILNALQK